MHARPDHADCRPDILIWIAILALWMIASRRESTSSGRLQQSSHICIWKEILKLDRTLRVVRTGSWIVWTYASWSSSKLLDIEEGPDGNPRRPDGWCFILMCVRTVCHVVQTVWHVVQTAGREQIFLTCKLESSGTLLNSGIPDKKHFYKDVILSSRMWPITN
jgi:hypothetical protein